MDEGLERLRKAADEQAERNKKNRMACENCGWFAVRGEEKIGECHRYPPTFDMPEGEEWKFASVSRDNVCGEFVHRRTGAYGAIAVRLARLEKENDRLRAAATGDI